MKKFALLITLLAAFSSQAQMDTDALSLQVSKAEEANLQLLKEYLWKRKSEAYVDGQLKATLLTDFSFDAEGKVQAKVIDAQTSVKQKPGIRGNIQKNAVEAKMDYVEKALGLALQYTYMSKGQLIDFFSKATFSNKEDGTIVATADNVYIQGDKLTVHIDPKTHLFTYKEFKSFLDKDPIDGVVHYATLGSGVSHVSNTVLNMPAQKMKIDATNQDYSQRVK